MAASISPTFPKAPGQGLTSAVFDRTTPRGFYGVCGYRICGNRVVRIDMLERLADIIRDRVFWRPRIPEEKRPAGSVEGGGFTIVPDMMSLVGCSGEDFQAILRSLDFRMHRKKVKVRKPNGRIRSPKLHRRCRRRQPPAAEATPSRRTHRDPGRRNCRPPISASRVYEPEAATEAPRAEASSAEAPAEAGAR